MASDEQSVKREGFIESWRNLRNSITVEPLAILFSLEGIGSTAINWFYLEKACAVTFGCNDQVCDFFSQLEDIPICKAGNNITTVAGVENFTEFKNVTCSAHLNSTNAVTEMQTVVAPVVGIVKILVLLLVGSWSDRVKLYKPCLILPLLANMLTYVVLIICKIFMREIPLLVAGILPEVILCLSGGPGLFYTGLYSFLTLGVEEYDRTFRFGFVNFLMLITSVVVTSLSGPIFKLVGFMSVMIICAITQIVAVFFCLFVLKEPKENDKSDKTNNVDGSKKVYINSLRKLFDVTSAKDLWQMLIKKREFNARSIIYISLLVYFINWGSFPDGIATGNLTNKDHWISTAGYYNSYGTLTNALGTLLVANILSQRLQVPDQLLCVFSAVCTLIGKCILVTAVSLEILNLLFAATTIDLFENSREILIRSMLSKVVAENEIAKISCVLGILTAVAEISYVPLFVTVFKKTATTFISTVYFLSAGFLIVSIGCYIMLFLMSRHSNRDKAEAQASAKQGIDNPAVDMTAV